MVLISKLRSFVGTLKDRASLSKAAIFSSSTTDHSPPTTATTATTASDIIVLRLTTHKPSKSPANPEHVSAFLSFGNGPRVSAASAITALLSRLNSTRSPTVVLKCLNVIHHVIHHGNFILHDQLFSLLHPRLFGGYNHLNLSGFRHGSLACSSRIRWYARFLELIISTYRIMDMSFDFITGGNSRYCQILEKLPTLENSELLREVEALVGILEEIRNAPDYVECDGNNRLVKETLRLVDDDRAPVEDGILIRMKEMGDRMDRIGFGDSVQLNCLLRRLEDCSRYLTYFQYGKEGEVKKHGGALSEVVSELREKVAAVVVEKGEESRSIIRKGRGRGSESFHIDHSRVPLSLNGSVEFRSTRWGIN